MFYAAAVAAAADDYDDDNPNSELDYLAWHHGKRSSSLLELGTPWK